MITTGQSSNIVRNIRHIRHIEVKAYLDNFQTVCDRVAALADKPPIDRVQHDTFFHCRSGRLKLRSSGQLHDLIYYRRRDDYGPTESIYQTARTNNPTALRSSLNSAFGEAGRVKKFRRTYRIGNSMVHLDRVGGLGEFLEIKTRLGDDLFDEMGDELFFEQDGEQDGELGGLSSTDRSVTPEKAVGIVESLMTTLQVDLFQLIDGAYIDLINERKGLPDGSITGTLPKH